MYPSSMSTCAIALYSLGHSPPRACACTWKGVACHAHSSRWSGWCNIRAHLVRMHGMHCHVDTEQGMVCSETAWCCIRSLLALTGQIYLQRSPEHAEGHVRALPEPLEQGHLHRLLLSVPSNQCHWQPCHHPAHRESNTAVHVDMKAEVLSWPYTCLKHHAASSEISPKTNSHHWTYSDPAITRAHLAYCTSVDRCGTRHGLLVLSIMRPCSVNSAAATCSKADPTPQYNACTGLACSALYCSSTCAATGIAWGNTPGTRPH